MQSIVGISLHPAIAPNPCRPVRLDLLRERPKSPLQNGHALLRLLRSRDKRDPRDPRADVEIIHPRTDPADERTLGDSSRERLDNEDLDAVPEGRRPGEEALLALVGDLAV